jgi:hypothetical protein
LGAQEVHQLLLFLLWDAPVFSANFLESLLVHLRKARPEDLVNAEEVCSSPTAPSHRIWIQPIKHATCLSRRDGLAPRAVGNLCQKTDKFPVLFAQR